MNDVIDDEIEEAESPTTVRQGLFPSSNRALVVRTAAVAIFDALVIYVIAQLAANGSWAVMGVMIAAAVAVNASYLNPRAQASRWLTPGLVMMAIFVVYPVLYTTYLSFTNYQTGNLLSRDQAIERLEQARIQGSESGAVLTMSVYRDGSDTLALLVTGDDVEPFIGRLATDPEAPEADPVVDLADTEIDPAAPPETLGEFTLLSGLDVAGESQRLERAVVGLPGGSSAAVETLTSARVVTGGGRFDYDPDTDTLLDNQTGRTCESGVGTFYCDGVPEDEVQQVARLASGSTIVCDGGTCDDVPLFALDQSLAGWRQVIGVDNYVDVLTNERIRAPFVRVLLWNIVFAAGSVFLNFAFGLGLAMVLKDDNMRGRAIYRSIYIIPYAIPAFLSILVWRGLLNTEFGAVNDLISGIGLPGIGWLDSSGYTAMIAILLVNLWLGFPYMFLICSGALTTIPEELLEAARVDGAGAWRSFSTITLPLLLVSTAPLLIGAFAFNFNNFVLIFLLTSGGPPLSGYDVPVGATDILISFTFDIAAGAGRGNQYALATAIVVIIFIVLATTSALSFRLTRKLEEIYE